MEILGEQYGLCCGVRNADAGGTVRNDMGKHRWVMIAVGLVFLFVAAAGCATPTGREASSGQSQPATGSLGTVSPGNPGPTDVGTPSPSKEGPTEMVTSNPPGAARTLRGIPTDGVEANCVVM